MSQLAYTASFVRMGASPWGSKPKDVPVFAQHLAGGSGLTIFTNVLEPDLVVRLCQVELFAPAKLMAGFVAAEPRLHLEGEALQVAERLRAGARSGEVEVPDCDALVLA